MTCQTAKRVHEHHLPITLRSVMAVLSVFAFCIALAFSANPEAGKAAQETQVTAEGGDPVMGDWEGTLTQKGKKQPERLVAQVVALGKGRYHATLLSEFDKRTTPVASLEGLTSGTVVRFMGWGDASCYRGPDWEGVIEGDSFRGSVPGREGGTFLLKKVVRLSPTLGQKPPTGAVVLFDGANFDQWEVPPRRPAKKPVSGKPTAGKRAAEKPAAIGAPKETAPLPQPGPVKWQIVDGAMRCTKGSGSIITKRKFNGFQLHLEFRTPFVPEAREQGRGNSGVLFHGFEIQVLDTYGLVGRNKECGAIYNRVSPLVNMCAPPLQWQTYDVTIQAPDKTGNARLTVLQNGVKIHDNLEVGPIANPSGIVLQDHSNPIEYRNIWLVELP